MAEWGVAAPEPAYVTEHHWNDSTMFAGPAGNPLVAKLECAVSLVRRLAAGGGGENDTLVDIESAQVFAAPSLAKIHEATGVRTPQNCNATKVLPCADLT